MKTSNNDATDSNGMVGLDDFGRRQPWEPKSQVNSSPRDRNQHLVERGPQQHHQQQQQHYQQRDQQRQQQQHPRTHQRHDDMGRRSNYPNNRSYRSDGDGGRHGAYNQRSALNNSHHNKGQRQQRSEQRVQLMNQLSRDVSWRQREYPPQADPSILRLLFSDSPNRNETVDPSLSQRRLSTSTNNKNGHRDSSNRDSKGTPIPKQRRRPLKREDDSSSRDRTSTSDDSSSSSSSSSSTTTSGDESSSNDRRSKRREPSRRRGARPQQRSRRVASSSKNRKASTGRHKRRRYSSSSESASTSSSTSSSEENGDDKRESNDPEKTRKSIIKKADNSVAPPFQATLNSDGRRGAGGPDQGTIANAAGETSHDRNDDDDDDDDSVGPQPTTSTRGNDTAADGTHIGIGGVGGGGAAHYGKALLPGEGQAMASFVQQNLRVPRRGEIGYDAEEIERYEKSGYVMSGSRHARMNAVRIRKENQVYSAEEQRALALITLQENQQKEAELLQDWKEMLQDRRERQAASRRQPPQDSSRQGNGAKADP